ncbi:MAG: LysR family transcriptional regulator [Rhizomicrobium sp.]
MPLNTRAMQLYIAVVDAGNFSEVARGENISPSSVSRIIQQLENDLGSQLLYRNTRAIIPTEAGRLYAERFRQILGDLNETAQLLQDRKKEPGGLVRINAPVAFGQRHISPWLAELTTKHPRLQIELVLTDTFIDPLTDAADLLFRISPLQDSGFHVRVVDRPVYHLAASTAYLDRYGYPEKPSDLREHHCLVYKGVMGAQRSYFSRTGHDPETHALNGPLISNSAETLITTALGGAGVIMMPDWLIGEHLLDGKLVRLLPDYQVSTTQDELVIAMLYPHTRFLPLSIRTVIDFFVGKFGTPTYWKYRT